MVFFPFLSNIATGFCCLAYCSTAYRRPQIRRRPETISRLPEPARWDGHRTPTVHREGCAVAQAYLRVRIADPGSAGVDNSATTAPLRKLEHGLQPDGNVPLPE